MPLTIVAGGQYGGEGKGLITAHLAKKAEILVKIGGPNSAHSFGVDDKMYRVRMIPSGSNLGPSFLVFPPGCLLHIETLFNEIDMLGFTGKLLIDFNVGIVDAEIVKAQQEDSFYNGVGSTLTGTGHATSRRALRRLRLAKNEPRLKEYLADTSMFLHDALRRNCQIVAEGAQAYGLSNYHGDYPYVSSRDTTAGSILSQMGIGPKLVDKIILVVKCFPTRNKGGQGRLANELDEFFIQKNKEFLLETGGGTFGAKDSPRRVGLFDYNIVDRAFMANTPSMIALTGADRLEGLITDKIVFEHYGTLENFVNKLETRYQIPVGYISKGPYVTDVDEKRTPDHKFNGSSQIVFPNLQNKFAR